MFKKCKICDSSVESHRIYCSNECKYADPELNAKRSRKDKNDTNTHLICKLCGWKSKDPKNLSGGVTKHLTTKHNISTNNYMDHFNEFVPDTIKYWECPLCDWKSKDLTNKSGWITIHIKSHNISENDFYLKYPELKIQTDKLSKRELEPEKSIICKICGKRMLSFSNSHAKTHGITVKEYKEKYGLDTIISEYTKNNLVKCGGTKRQNFTSKQELEITDYIKSLNVKIVQSHKLQTVEIDIFLPEYNIGIEYNGLYWHSELNGKTQNYHINKTIFANKFGIHLIQIFEDEWLYKSDIIKSKILNLLNKTPFKVYARKCIIKEITASQASEFMNINHLQGYANSNIKIGAFYNNQLISVMTLSEPRIALGKSKNSDFYELTRFANKLYYSNVGIFSKFIKYIKNNYEYINEIHSFGDARYVNINNNVYLKNDFKYTYTTKPNYWYMYRHQNRQHRYNFRKNILKSKLPKFDNTLSEWENMQNNHYDRIWDCGNYKYILNTKEI